MSIEIIDFLEPGERGGRCPAVMDDNLSREAGVVPAAFADYPELLRQELCAELTTLNHYGLGDVGCALVDGLFALAVRSRRGPSAAWSRTDGGNRRLSC
jgi:hypothetical protein